MNLKIEISKFEEALNNYVSDYSSIQATDCTTEEEFEAAKSKFKKLSQEVEVFLKKLYPPPRWVRDTN